MGDEHKTIPFNVTCILHSHPDDVIYIKPTHRNQNIPVEVNILSEQQIFYCIPRASLMTLL